MFVIILFYDKYKYKKTNGTKQTVANTGAGTCVKYFASTIVSTIKRAVRCAGSDERRFSSSITSEPFSIGRIESVLPPFDLESRSRIKDKVKRVENVVWYMKIKEEDERK